MSVDELVEEPVAPGGNGAPPPVTIEEWKQGKNGMYVPRRDGRPGVINRQGDEETVEQARVRDSSTPPGERRPRRKTKTPPKPRAPKQADLKQLELALAEGLKAPGSICASLLQDDWPAEHFSAAGPYLARNLVVACEFNPWLRSKLEQAASGEEAMMKMVAVSMLTGAMVMYLAPPTIYFLNLGVPPGVRERLNIPPRRGEAHPQGHAPGAPDPADQAAVAA